METRCEAKRWQDRDYVQCSRPSRSEGLCGPHLAAKRRRERLREAARDLRERLKREALEAERLEKKADQAVVALMREFGVEAQVHYSRDRATGDVVVDPDGLLSILRHFYRRSR